MYQTLSLQYQMIGGARQALFAYLQTMQPEDVFKPVAEFNNTAICSVLVHNANTYVHWLKSVGMKTPVPFFEDGNFETLADIKSIYETVDVIVTDFLTRYQNDMETPVEFDVTRKNMRLTLSPLELFTHVITHEFHHKGQILTMSRILGYTPADTDVIRY